MSTLSPIDLLEQAADKGEAISLTAEQVRKLVEQIEARVDRAYDNGVFSGSGGDGGE